MAISSHVITFIVQGIEYSVSSFTISDGAFGTCFYFGTGFHGYVSNPFFFKYISSSIGSTYRDLNNYIKFNILNKRFYSCTKTQSKLSPHWITGFTDAEGSFSLKVAKKSTLKSGWSVIPAFSIELHIRDTQLIREIHSFFGVGIVSERKDRNIIVYSVQSYRDIINVIIPHFDKFPLITQKKADYLLFKRGVELLALKAKSIEGIREIISLKASMNTGLSETFKTQFPTVLPVPRPLVCFQGIPDPNWMAGFVDGEGCFYVKVLKNNAYLCGYQVIISFSISQHARDEALLAKLIDYLGCGKIEKVSTRPSSATFVVYKFNDVYDKIIPFFQKFPLHGVKSMDFKDFSTVAELIKNKSHITLEGLKKIRSLKSGMNTGRIYN